LFIAGQEIFSGHEVFHNFDVGQSIPPIHPIRKFLTRSRPVVVDGSSRSEGGVCQVNL
jgi:hypothetical protein